MRVTYVWTQLDVAHRAKSLIASNWRRWKSCPASIDAERTTRKLDGVGRFEHGVPRGFDRVAERVGDEDVVVITRGQQLVVGTIDVIKVQLPGDPLRELDHASRRRMVHV